jgi:serine/threonine protein kinase
MNSHRAIRPQNPSASPFPSNPGCANPIGLESQKMILPMALATNTSRKVLRIGTDIVAKFGPEVNLAEAEAMAFIRENSTIPVPEILEAYGQDGDNYIIMEYIQGASLSKAWESLSTEDKSAITKELKDYICQMRQLTPPDGVLIGSVTGGPAVDRRQLGSAAGGPFRSEVEFNEWQLAQLYPKNPLSQREMYTAVHRSDHRIVFTHGDLAFHNIIVNDGHIKAIVDWECSGWYPEHWDYCKTLSFIGGTEEGYLVCKKTYEKQYHPEFFLQTWFGREILHGGF